LTEAAAICPPYIEGESVDILSLFRRNKNAQGRNRAYRVQITVQRSAKRYTHKWRLIEHKGSPIMTEQEVSELDMQIASFVGHWVNQDDKTGGLETIRWF
jgi:hypothetical protein